MQTNNYKDNYYQLLKVTEIADTVCAHSHQIRLHSVHPIREHADTLPPVVTLRACGLALMHNGGANPDTDHHRKGKRPLTAR